MNTIYHMPTPGTFADVAAWMAGKQGKKAAHNTYVIRCDNAYSVLYHGNEIIRYELDEIIVTHCGWPTSTTCERFRHLLPFSAHRKFSYEKGADGKKAWRARVEEQAIFVAGQRLPDGGSHIILGWPKEG